VEEDGSAALGGRSRGCPPAKGLRGLAASPAWGSPCLAPGSPLRVLGRVGMAGRRKALGEASPDDEGRCWWGLEDLEKERPPWPSIGKGLGEGAG